MTARNKLIFGLITSFMISMISFSCNPHRAGHTAGQIGATGKVKKHRAPATAKRKRTVKY